jgi:hypothetical protein
VTADSDYGFNTVYSDNISNIWFMKKRTL